MHLRHGDMFDLLWGFSYHQLAYLPAPGVAVVVLVVVLLLLLLFSSLWIRHPLWSYLISTTHTDPIFNVQGPPSCFILPYRNICVCVYKCTCLCVCVYTHTKRNNPLHEQKPLLTIYCGLCFKCSEITISSCCHRAPTEAEVPLPILQGKRVETG